MLEEYLPGPWIKSPGPSSLPGVMLRYNLNNLTITILVVDTRMLFSSHVAVCLAALAAAVTAVCRASKSHSSSTNTTSKNPLPQDRDIIPGYSIVPMQWSVKPFPDRDEYVNVTGTIQQMIAEVNKVNPDYEKLLLAAADKYREESGNLDKRGLNKRWVYAGHFCFGRWPGASILAIEEGISYLNSIGGRPHIGSGPGVCSRVSCSNNAGIFWCNDVSMPVHVV